MIVGALRLAFQIPPQGLTTRGAAQKIKDHLWAKFKCAVAEIPVAGSQELIVGVSLVGSDPKLLKDRLNSIIRNLHDWSEIELVHSETELIHFEDLELEKDFAKYDP